MTAKPAAWRQRWEALWRGWTAAGPGAPTYWVFWFLTLALFAAGLALAWFVWGDLVTGNPRYVLAPEQYHLTPTPPWIQADVKAEVLRHGALRGLSLLDRRCAERVAAAFAAHTWVAKVKRVAKSYPPRVDIEVEYRQPAAMVEVYKNGQPGLLPVDGDGVLLPPSDFAPAHARNYLRVSAPSEPAEPAGPPGVKWGDRRVEAAAAIARAWENRWQEARLYRVEPIEPAPDPEAAPARPGDEPMFALHTRDGAAVLWGHAPGREIPGEATASTKIERVLAHIRQHGPLEGHDPPRRLDARDAAGVKEARGL